MKMHREVTTDHMKGMEVVREEAQEAGKGYIIKGLGNSAQEPLRQWGVMKIF